MAETTRIGKNARGYGYKYTDLASIHEWLEENGYTYFQEVVPEVYGDTVAEYIWTEVYRNGEKLRRVRGCRVFAVPVESKNGKAVTNVAQEIGSGLTYARRYSLLMAFGLACEDDDAASLTKDRPAPAREATRKPAPLAPAITPEQVEEIKTLIEVSQADERAFCKFYKCARVEALASTDYASAVQFLNQKISKMTSAGPAVDESGLPDALR